MKFNTLIEKKWIESAQKLNRTIVIPEASFSERMCLAGIECAKNDICNIIFLTDRDDAFDQYKVEKYNRIRVINYLNHEALPLMISSLVELRKSKGLTEDQAKELLKDPVYFGTMLVELDMADGLVAGAEISTAKTFKPAFQIIKAKSKDNIISSFFVMVKPDKKDEQVYLLSDCGVNINPSMEEIVDIAKASAFSAESIAFLDPKVALLSYSTKGSAEGDCALKMRGAFEVLKAQEVDFVVDGELQLDAAIVPEVGVAKAPGSPVAGKANVLVFPSLEAGNIGYKLVQRFAGATAIGPILQGLAAPINDLSRGCSAEDIYLTVAVAAVQSIQLKASRNK